MQRFIVPIAGAALLALTACGDSKVETAKSEKGASVSIDIDKDESKPATASAVAIDGDTDSGKFELSLPGGIEAKVNLPDGIGKEGKFDIDGVGLYPGAVVRSVKVNASAAEAKRAVVQIGFTAPGDAAAVADWYQQQFDAKHRAVTRSGETLSGKTEDGDDFTIALASAGAGRSSGILTITDAKSG